MGYHMTRLGLTRAAWAEAEAEAGVGAGVARGPETSEAASERAAPGPVLGLLPCHQQYLTI